MKKINTQRILLVTLVAVAFFGFLLWSIQQSLMEEIALADSQTLVNPQSPLTNNMISVSAPRLNSEIKSPVVVSGQANLSGNKLKVRIKDSKNLILKETFVKTKNSKQMSAFSTSLVYKKPSSAKGVIEIFLVSSKDNSEIYKVTIPVTFKD